MIGFHALHDLQRYTVPSYFSSSGSVFFLPPHLRALEQLFLPPHFQHPSFCVLVMPVDHALDVAGLLIDLRQQDYDDGEALTHRPALHTPCPRSSSSIADLAQAIKAQGCGYETSDSSLKRLAPEEEEGVGSIEEKHLKRMRRNRESAALSRNRKKCYIEELEAKVAKLTETVCGLQSENATLQHERATLQQPRMDMSAPSSPSTAELASED